VNEVRAFGGRHGFMTLLLVYIVLGIATLTADHSWGDDWAQYVVHARNLVAGLPYGDTGYIFNPDAPNVGPPEYPPGLPLLLAPVIAAFGTNIIALKLVCFGCLVAALPFAYRALSISFGKIIAAIAVLFFALHDQVWALREEIGSQAPYILFSMLALWYAARETTLHPRSWSAARAGLWVGSLTYASVACRSIGIALLPALLFYGWGRQKPVQWFVGVIGSFLLLILLQEWLIVTPPTYASELKMPGVGLILGNLQGYWFALGWLFRLPLGLSQVASTVVIVLAAVGTWSVYMRRDPATAAVADMRTLAGRVPLAVWYLLAYLAALILASIAPNARYLLPVLPIIVALAATGVAHFAKRVTHPRRYAIATACAVLLYYTALHVSAAKLRADQLATCESCNELYAFVRAETPPDAVIAFAKPRALALFGQRAAWMWSTEYGPDELRRKLQKVGAGFLIIAAPETALGEQYPASLGLSSLETEGAQPVFRNGMFTVIKLRNP
jgi:hypothetical protein